MAVEAKQDYARERDGWEAPVQVHAVVDRKRHQRCDQDHSPGARGVREGKAVPGHRGARQADQECEAREDRNGQPVFRRDLQVEVVRVLPARVGELLVMSQRDGECPGAHAHPRVVADHGPGPFQDGQTPLDRGVAALVRSARPDEPQEAEQSVTHEVDSAGEEKRGSACPQPSPRPPAFSLQQRPAQNPDTRRQHGAPRAREVEAGGK